LDNIKRQLTTKSSLYDSDDILVGSVDIGNMEDAGDSSKCDSKNDENCAVNL
jgi:hypothetical protein